jgi:hypothetical protein
MGVSYPLAAASTCQLPMRQRPPHLPPSAPRRYGFSLLELGVAMAVLGFALLGGFPLVVVYSRGLSKLERSSPMDLPGVSTTWYLIPSSDPWARKLGAAAQVTADASKLLASASVVPALLLRDDDNDATDSDNDGVEDYTDTGWDYEASASGAFQQDCHVHEALPAGQGSGGCAVWSLAVSTAGWYAIQATWPTSSGRTLTTVQYQIRLAGTPIAGSPFSIDQTNTAAGFQDGTGVWFKLAPGLVYLTPGLLQVQLSDVQPVSTETGRYVLADTVRLVQNDVQVVSLQKSLDTENATAHVSVTTRIAK